MQSTSIIVIVLTIALVAAAVLVGTQVFKKNSVDAARDALADELKDLAVISLKHFNRPGFLGGGGNSFKNLDKIRRKNSKSRVKSDKDKKTKNIKGTQIWETQTGMYFVVIAEKDSAVIQGVGDEIGSDGVNPVSVQLVVKKDSRYLKILN